MSLTSRPGKGQNSGVGTGKNQGHHNKPLQKSARPDLRPFNKGELARILRVGQCLPCHKEYNDKVYTNYTPERKYPVFDDESGSKRK